MKCRTSSPWQDAVSPKIDVVKNGTGLILGRCSQNEDNQLGEPTFHLQLIKVIKLYRWGTTGKALFCLWFHLLIWTASVHAGFSFKSWLDIRKQMKKERGVKVYGQRCVNWESEQNPEQSTPVHQSVKVSIEFKVEKRTKWRKENKNNNKKSNKEATKSKRKGILELQDQKQIWKELSEASHAEVLNVCTWEDERAQTSPLSLGSLLMPVRDRGCSTRRFSLVLHMFLSAMGIYPSIQTWESGLLVVTAAEMQNLRYTGFYFPSFILG